jgi:hypothetical protein
MLRVDQVWSGSWFRSFETIWDKVELTTARMNPSVLGPWRIRRAIQIRCQRSKKKKKINKKSQKIDIGFLSSLIGKMSRHFSSLWSSGRQLQVSTWKLRFNFWASLTFILHFMLEFNLCLICNFFCGERCVRWMLPDDSTVWCLMQREIKSIPSVIINLSAA